MNGDNVHLLAGAYALNALPVDERAFYERHLAVCEACRLEVAEYTETAATLGAAASEQPPAHLRERVLASAEQTRQLSSQLSSLPAQGSRSGGLRAVLAPVAAALAVAVLGLSGLSAYLYDANRGLQELVAQSSGTGDLPVFLAHAQMVALDAPAGVAAGFVHSADHDRGMLVVDGLAALDPDQDYQLWLFHDGEPVPAGVFEVGRDGVVMFSLDGKVRDAEVVAVTVEPAGGLPEPTGEVLLSADL